MYAKFSQTSNAALLALCLELFEGDIIMDEDLRSAVLGEADKRSVYTNKDKLWLDGMVYYAFDPQISK